MLNVFGGNLQLLSILYSKFKGGAVATLLSVYNMFYTLDKLHKLLVICLVY